MEIDKLIKDINKKYKKDIVMRGTEIQQIKKIPFSSPIPNYMTRGGVAIGKLTEISGGEGSAKTSTVLDLMKNYLEDEELYRDRPYILYLDAENTLDESWAEKMGVDMDRVILLKPQEEHGEMLLDMALDVIRTGEVGMLIVDSIPFLMSKQEYEGNLEDKTYGGNSILMTMFCRKVIPLMNKYNTTTIMINQIRDKIGVPYTAYNFPGGRMLKFSYSQRIFLRKGSLLDKDYNEKNSSFESPVGNIVEMRYLKNKVSKNDRMDGRYTLNYTDGIDVVNDTIELGVRLGVIKQSGSWFEYGGDNVQGKSKMTDIIRNDVEKFSVLKAEVMKLAIEG